MGPECDKVYSTPSRLSACGAQSPHVPHLSLLQKERGSHSWGVLEKSEWPVGTWGQALGGPTRGSVSLCDFGAISSAGAVSSAGGGVPPEAA